MRHRVGTKIFGEQDLCCCCMYTKDIIYKLSEKIKTLSVNYNHSIILYINGKWAILPCGLDEVPVKASLDQ